MKGLMEETRCAKPCRKCGGTERYPSGGCKACGRENQRKYCKANREKVLDCKRKNYEANREKRAEYARKYHEANREKQLECSRKYYEANREKVRESQRKYCEANREKRQKYYEANREKWQEYWRKWYTQKKFELMTGMLLRFGEIAGEARGGKEGR
jgi:hypothetical protein